MEREKEERERGLKRKREREIEREREREERGWGRSVKDSESANTFCNSWPSLVLLQLVMI